MSRAGPALIIDVDSGVTGSPGPMRGMLSESRPPQSQFPSLTGENNSPG